MNSYRQFVFFLFLSLTLQAQDTASPEPATTPAPAPAPKAKEIADPFGKVDLSKYEVKPGQTGEGEMPTSDIVVDHSFSKVKLEELPQNNIDQHAARLKYEIEMAKQNKNLPPQAAVGSGSGESAAQDVFAKQKVEIEKCVGKDIDTCARERAQKMLSNPEVVPQTETQVEAVQENPSAEQSEQVEVIQVKPAVSGQEINQDMVESKSVSATMPAKALPDSMVDQSLEKIQQTITAPDSLRAPAQQPTK